MKVTVVTSYDEDYEEYYVAVVQGSVSDSERDKFRGLVPGSTYFREVEVLASVDDIKKLKNLDDASDRCGAPDLSVGID